jgi:hypothetical protein
MNGVPSFLEKVIKHRPYIVCFVGLAIAKMVKAHCLPVILFLYLLPSDAKPGHRRVQLVEAS